MAELTVFEETGHFLAVERAPEESPAVRPRGWPEETGFDLIDWRPHEATSGVYWVEVDVERSEFVAHGLIDADGDGVPAHYVANRVEKAQMISPNDVY